MTPKFNPGRDRMIMMPVPGLGINLPTLSLEFPSPLLFSLVLTFFECDDDENSKRSQGLSGHAWVRSHGDSRQRQREPLFFL